MWWVMPAGALAGCALEWVFVVLFRFPEFANLWELQWGTLWLLPTAAILAIGCGLLWAALWWSAWSCRSRRVAAAVIAAGLSAAWLGYELTHGRHFDLWWRRIGFIAVLATAGAAGVFWGHGKLRDWLHHHPSRTAWAAVACAILLETVNRFVLVRLYPAFHVALAVLSLGAAALAALGVYQWHLSNDGNPRHQSVRAWLLARGPFVSWLAHAWAAPLILATLLVAAAVPAARILASFDNFRWIVTQNAPLLGFATQVSGMLAPPPPVLAEQTTIEDPHRKSAQLGWTGRDILLITVDALRADHLGAYGYPRPTSPHMDGLAKGGVRFERAYAATPHTSYSVTSLMTGKYMRPLLLQGLGEDSETWAELLRRYGYRTAGFYPPAIFFIDPERFRAFDERMLGFEYQKREFLEGSARVEQVKQYLADQPPDQALFVWLHLFGPHEPYEKHPEYDFGATDIDRYDSEIRAADETIGAVVRAFRERSPDALVIITADHGEEFGDHGGRYHGSSVYEEQVRVPLLMQAPGIAPGVVSRPVQTVDLLPTVLSILDIPVRPRIRGNDLTPLLAGVPDDDPGFAFAETDEQVLLAESTYRLLCLRRLGACQLFDLASDPEQRTDVSKRHPDIMSAMRDRLRALNSHHGRYERAGGRAEGTHWPGPILRGLAGDADAATEVAALLDDADVHIRRKAAAVLFDLAVPQTVTPLRLALQRDEDEEVRAYSALALTRMGEGASLTRELLASEQQFWRRRAALVLAETGESKGRDELLAWWMDEENRDFDTSRRLLEAFARGKVKDAVWPLTRSLHDVRLRPHIATALAAIGDEMATNALLVALKQEPYQTNRLILADALLKLGAEHELVVPLRRWLGVPDPLPGGLRIATAAGILEQVGGPSERDLDRLRNNANLGQLIRVVVPKTGNGNGIRLLVAARNRASDALQLRVGVPRGVFSYDSKGNRVTSRKLAEIDPSRQALITFPPGSEVQERHSLAPPELGLEPGRATYLVVFAEHGLSVEALAALPLQSELGLDTDASTDPAAPAHASKKDEAGGIGARNSVANE